MGIPPRPVQSSVSKLLLRLTPKDPIPLAPEYERTGHQSLEQQENYGEVQVDSYEQWRERQGGEPAAAPAAAADAPAADAPAADPSTAPTVNE